MGKNMKAGIKRACELAIGGVAICKRPWVQGWPHAGEAF